MTEYNFNKELEIIKEDWKGNIKIDGEYSNGTMKNKQIMPLDILKWKLSKNPQAKEKKDDNFKLKVIKNTDFLNSDKDMIVWLGHATFFIRLNGKTFITDPVFYNIPLIKRLADLPCEADSLNNIDYILLSHGHRDHFDKKSIETLFKINPDIEALIPLELNKFFDKKGIKNQQAGWYQKYNIGDSIEVFFMPAKHWNRRSALDFNKNLWGSFVIRFNNKTIYLAGDTAYGTHFKETHKFFNNIDYCLMPVAAYKPENIMKDTHMNPHEALKGFEDLHGKIFIPMHFGTYDLSDEPLGEPVRILENERNNFNIKMLDVGEILAI